MLAGIIEAAVSTERSTARQQRVLREEGHNCCKQFIIQVDFYRLSTESDVFFRLPAILDPVKVARNEHTSSRLTAQDGLLYLADIWRGYLELVTSALRQAATSCTLPTL